MYICLHSDTKMYIQIPHVAWIGILWPPNLFVLSDEHCKDRILVLYITSNPLEYTVGIETCTCMSHKLPYNRFPMCFTRSTGGCAPLCLVPNWQVSRWSWLDGLFTRHPQVCSGLLYSLSLSLTLSLSDTHTRTHRTDLFIYIIRVQWWEEREHLWRRCDATRPVTCGVRQEGPRGVAVTRQNPSRCSANLGLSVSPGAPYLSLSLPHTHTLSLSLSISFFFISLHRAHNFSVYSLCAENGIFVEASCGCVLFCSK